MDRIGRVTMIVATLLFARGASVPCRAQPPAPLASSPTPPPQARDDHAVKRKPRAAQAD